MRKLRIWSAVIGKKIKNKYIISLIVLFSVIFLGWGGTAHYIINYNSVLSVLPQMTFFENWADSLAAHASDADYRKQFDPNEAPRHYIDIDNYPTYLLTGTIPQSFDSLVSIYGYSFVIDQGVLPWAILNTMDSLQSAFEDERYHDAMLYAADLGHYVADAYQPLHLTRNYNGQFTNQYGVHSRYESQMINQYSGQITYGGDTITYIDNESDFIFNMIYNNYNYVDSVLYADSVAAVFAGNTNSTEYYSKLWELTKQFTMSLFKSASNKLAGLIYTAWINSGNTATNIPLEIQNSPAQIKLYQNYPNPFNPTTKIKFSIPFSVISANTASKNYYSIVKLIVYDILGREVALLVNEEKLPGSYEVEFNSASVAGFLSSAIYFYRLTAYGYSETKKMIILR